VDVSTILCRQVTGVENLGDVIRIESVSGTVAHPSVVIGEFKGETVLQTVDFGGSQRWMKSDVTRQANDLDATRGADVDTIPRRESARRFNAQPLPRPVHHRASLLSTRGPHRHQAVDHP
jgi:hypothetical protein